MLSGLPLRRLAASLAVAGVVGLAFLPSAHVHETHDDHGTQTALLHSHVESDHSDVDGSEHGLEDADHDGRGRVVWISVVFSGPEPTPHPHSTDALQAQGALVVAQEAPPRLTGPPLDTAAHGPPGATNTALRAPPSFPA